jgi:predicted dehydrogenase
MQHTSFPSVPALTRRQFLRGTTLSTAAFMTLPASVLGLRGAPSANSKLNLVGIGVGGQGAHDLGQMESENIVALCDVDKDRAGQTFRKHPKARQFTDYRQMLDHLRDIDAVVVATPDHHHAFAAMEAIKRGKHVYCEKPLTHSVWEARQLARAAREAKVATQMGNQGQASDSTRRLCEYVWAGAIGQVREAHIYEYETIRPGSPSYYDDLKHIQDDVPVPPEMNWDLWLGPAPSRPFNSMYHPNRWRYWYDFGAGKLGDHGPHYIDPIVWALDLGLPETVEAVGTDAEWETVSDKTQKYPQFAVVRYGFPARGKQPPVTLFWHHNDKLPPLPKWWKAEDKPPTGGGIIVGTNGAIVFGPIYASKPGAMQQVKLIPEELNRDYKRPARTVPRIESSHWMEWVDCAKAGKPTSADFAYGGIISEIALVGDIAIRNKGKLLRYDAKRGRFTDSEANKLLQRPSYRKGFELPT